MGVAQKAFLFAAGLFLAMAFIFMGVDVYKNASETTKAALAENSAIQSELAETQYLMYDNVNHSGSQVLNALRKFKEKEQFGIRVFTGKDTSGQWYNNEVDSTGIITGDGSKNLEIATDESLNTYINPSGKFSANLVRDKNNTIRAIIFKQNP